MRARINHGTNKKGGIMKKSSIAVGLAVLLFLAFVLLPMVSHAQQKVISLRFATFVPATTMEGKLIQEWADEVGKRTNGRVKVTVYPAGTLIPVTQMYDGITKEVADIGYGIFSYIRGRFPLTEAIDLPLGYKNAGVPTKLINAYYKKFKPKEMDDVKVLFLEAHGPGMLNAKKPISKLEDLKGMKIRAHNISAKIVTALGAAPVGLPITDTYDALSKGVVEGVMLEAGGVLNWGLADVVKYHVGSPAVAYTTSFYTVMNKEKWNSLPPDIQVIIDKLDEEWIERASKRWVDWEIMGMTELPKKGNKFITLSKEENDRWEAKVKPIVEEWVKAAQAKGLPGAEVVKFCQDYLKANQK